MRIRVAILTVSDRCARCETVDTAGPALAAVCRDSFGAEVVVTACIPDERLLITCTLRDWAINTPRPDLVLSTGGTGLAPRDVTPEATLDALERRHSGLMELIRLRCYETTPRTFLSRGEAGTIGRTLVINLPGSQRGAVECLKALLDVLPHAIDTLRGDVQDDGRPDAVPTTGRVVRHGDA